MKKPFTILLFLFTIMLLLSSCNLFGDRGTRIIKNSEKKKEYSAKLNIKFINDKETTEENWEGTFSNDKVHIMLLGSGKTITWTNGKLVINVKENNINYSETQGADALYRYILPNEYIKKAKIGDGKKYFFTNKAGKEYLVVEVFIAGENKNLCKGIMYLDVKNYLPEKIIIYDNDGKEKVIVSYSDYKTL